MAAEAEALTMRAVVTTEAPAAPVLVSLYSDSGLAGRIELSPVVALNLALDLLTIATPKATNDA